MPFFIFMACKAWSGAFWTKWRRRLESEVVPLLFFIITPVQHEVINMHGDILTY